ncbi:MAG TPA: hypothetical protein DCQ31_04995, partial [Bacteroidales bacterium]|nr:hypothetical protein [Bacteroidales bacterium]
MCGVVSIIYEKDNKQIGNEAVSLLKKLEYRGYDSTGASFFKENGEILLMKKVGSPTKVTQELEIGKHIGQKFIGQVRWATYGAVTNENAQPHEVNCKIHIAGAHNGNISNTDSLKLFLRENGHKVLSDNDGEMLVHMVEHFYAIEFHKLKNPSVEEKKKAFIRAIRTAQSKVIGSYASCIAAPDIPGVFAMKSGSSLYAGKGHDANGDFIVVSSDLTSVLGKTRFLIPLSEGDGLYFTHNEYKIFSLKEEKEWVPSLTRSRLNIADIALQPRYSYFMEQEIASSPSNLDTLLKYYIEEEQERELYDIFEKNYQACRGLLYDIVKLYDIFDSTAIKAHYDTILNNPDFIAMYKVVEKKAPHILKAAESTGFSSEDSQLLNELLSFDVAQLKRLFVLDMLIIWKKKRTIVTYKKRVVEIFKAAKSSTNRIYMVASGTSYHAALIGGYFFNSVAGVAIIPSNPGQFRSNFIDSLAANDIVIGISQSGETKDLVDIFNDIRARYENGVKIFSIVNNENSTIPQEKSDFYLPIMCGPEIAVAATKSFISQVALLYLLALATKLTDDEIKLKLAKIRSVMKFTLESIEMSITDVVLRLFLKPSMHILGTSLIGIAKEGALKIREVVLNHTEGYDSAEFKHGPNTILGKNTLFSFSELEEMHNGFVDFMLELTANKNDAEKAAAKSFLEHL